MTSRRRRPARSLSKATSVGSTGQTDQSAERRRRLGQHKWIDNACYQPLVVETLVVKRTFTAVAKYRGN
jgi:hypothetical protein